MKEFSEFRSDIDNTSEDTNDWTGFDNAPDEYGWDAGGGEDLNKETQSTDSDDDNNFMSLEEVQEYQEEGWKDVEEMRGEQWGTYEDGATMSHEQFLDEQDKFEAEIMNSDNSNSEISENSEIGEGDFDPEWANPSYEDIIAEPDATESDISWAAEGFSEAAHATQDEIHTAAEMIESSGIDGISPLPDGVGDVVDTVQAADAIGEAAVNAMDNNIEQIDDFGTGTAEAMHELDGSGLTATDVFMAESDYFASQSEDIGGSDDSSGADSSEE